MKVLAIAEHNNHEFACYITYCKRTKQIGTDLLVVAMIAKR